MKVSSTANIFSFSKLIPDCRWLRFEDLKDLWSFVGEQDCFELILLGESEEGRPLRSIKWGSGNTKILAWSQMHGNEPTASFAISDLLILLQDSSLKSLSAEIELHLIPMLNPDGAERFSRRNAHGIDLNRDAVAQFSKEIKAFYKYVDFLKPDWAFNLHDQRTIFTAGMSNKSASLSFLAPSAEVSRAVNPIRAMVMQLIAGIHHKIEPLAAGHFGRYTDEFYPRALGDNLMKDGIPTILFEMGHYPNDPYRRMARKLTCFGLIEAFMLISNGNWRDYKIDQYLSIPENGRNQRDLIFRGLHFQGRQLDISLMRKEIPDFKTGNLQVQYIIDDIGDLSHLNGIQEYKGTLTEFRDPAISELANLKVEGKMNFIFKDGVLREY